MGARGLPIRGDIPPAELRRLDGVSRTVRGAYVHRHALEA